jgi:hypothetical protein
MTDLSGSGACRLGGSFVIRWFSLLLKDGVDTLESAPSQQAPEVIEKKQLQMLIYVEDVILRLCLESQFVE